MAKVVAVTQSATSLAEVEAHFGLTRGQDANFFEEWRSPTPNLTAQERTVRSELTQVLLQALNHIGQAIV